MLTFEYMTPKQRVLFVLRRSAWLVHGIIVAIAALLIFDHFDKTIKIFEIRHPNGNITTLQCVKADENGHRRQLRHCEPEYMALSIMIPPK
jgi:hypothetical protein|tara:strand:+ start:20311 stop:20583 length:273 start_codon:yes stop_codon:yes gene_type:complete